MDFIIIANAWSAGKDNPTSKHRIAIELLWRGHRVLWIEGSGMRTPSVGSSSDRLRMARKVGAALRGVRREQGVQCSVISDRIPEEGIGQPGLESQRPAVGERPALNTEHRTPNTETSALWVLSPLFIPLPKYELIRRLNGLICRTSMRFWGWRLGFRDPVMINYVPVLAEAMRGWGRASPRLSSCPVAKLSRLSPKGSSSSTTQQPDNSTTGRLAPRVVYHCVDRWDAFSTYDARMMASMDRRCCELADLVIASSRDLVERCRRYSANVHLVSHGVDHAHFAQALQVTQRPADLPAGRVAGFFGLLSEWVDQELLIELARRIPECQIVLVGKADISVERLKGIRNVHLLGPRPFSQLPAYVAHFDVGLIPFVINELTVAVNPIKLREMLSAGCPVVSTALPEVQGYQGAGVDVAETQDDFISAVASRLQRPATAAERVAISASVAGETWAAKVDEILRLLDPKTA